MEIKSITETILIHLRSEIITESIEPNKKLNEAEIAKELGVSRSPVREAIRLLENDNFVIRIPRRGVYVPDLNIKDTKKLYHARRMIESFAMDLLKAKKITALEKAETALAHASQLAVPSMDDKREMLDYVMASSAFHVGLIEATDNDWLIRFYKSITYNMARYQLFCLSIPGILKRLNSCIEHKNILRQLKKGNHTEAKKLLLSHINNVNSFVEEEMKKRKR